MRTRVLPLVSLAAWLAAAGGVPAGAAGPPEAAAAGAAPPARNQQKDRTSVRPSQARAGSRADLTFSGTTMLDGSIQIEGRGGDLTFRKKVRQDGSFLLDMEAPHDKVTVAFSARAISIRRDRRTVTLSLGDGREEDLDRARRLLADSRAVRLLRIAASAAEAASDDGPSAAALVASDALVGFLSGDVGAPGRAARHLARRARARVRPVALQTDCYYDWEHKVFMASYDWEACASDFSVWNPIRNLCAARWLLAVESYWFTFIACSGLGGVF
jgi:hypothetical protein